MSPRIKLLSSVGILTTCVFQVFFIETNSLYLTRTQLNPWLLANYNAAIADFEKRHAKSIVDTEYFVKLSFSTQPLSVQNATITHAGIPSTTVEAKGNSIRFVALDEYEVKLVFPAYPPIVKWLKIPAIEKMPSTTPAVATLGEIPHASYDSEIMSMIGLIMMIFLITCFKYFKFEFKRLPSPHFSDENKDSGFEDCELN